MSKCSLKKRPTKKKTTKSGTKYENYYTDLFVALITMNYSQVKSVFVVP